MKTAGICTKISWVTSSKITLAAMAICAAGIARAATYYWGNSGTTDGNLANLSNWTTSTSAASGNPTAFSADDTYTVRSASALPSGTANWFLTGDADMLGVLSSTKNASSSAAPYEFAVNLGGFSLNVKNLACRGVMTFTNGVFTATGAATTVGHSSASDPSGILTFGEGAAATLSAISYLNTSGNSINVINGGTLTLNGESALNIGRVNNSTNNLLLVRGAGSKFTSSASVRVAGVDSGTEPTTSGNSVIVSDGGAMDVDALVIGGLNNSKGNSVTVEGSGSSLAVVGNTYVGGNGKTGCEGDLYVLDGASFNGSNVVIGKTSTNQTVVVSNATVNLSGALRLGGQTNAAGNYGGTNALLHVAGAAPSVTVAGDGIYVYAPAKMRFDIPSEGWDSAPVKVTGSAKRINFSTDDASLELVVHAKGAPIGRHVLISANNTIDFTKVSLSADCTGMVELDTSNSNEIAVNVKSPGLTIIFR